MKSIALFLSLVFVMPATLLAQENAKSMLDVAAKKAASGKGKVGDELNGILKEAAGLYDQVAAKYPAAQAECAHAHLEAGRLRKRVGDLTGAEASLKLTAAVAAEPKFASEALHDLATIYRKTKRTTEAQQALERIVAEFRSEPRQRAEALSRLAAMHRAAKKPELAEASLRQILSDHGDLWSASTEALDDLVALQIAQGQEAEAKKTLAAQGEALKAKFHGTRHEGRLKVVLDRIALRFKLDDDGE